VDLPHVEDQTVSCVRIVRHSRGRCCQHCCQTFVVVKQRLGSAARSKNSKLRWSETASQQPPALRPAPHGSELVGAQVVSLLQIAEILGHTVSNFTVRTYTHTWQELPDDAAAKMRELLERHGQPVPTRSSHLSMWCNRKFLLGPQHDMSMLARLARSADVTTSCHLGSTCSQDQAYAYPVS
jgi:hypothetical protein